MSILENFFGAYFGNVVFTNLFGCAIWTLLAWMCFKLAPDQAKLAWTYVLVTLLGALVGWGLGIYFAPHEEEKQSLVSLGQAISVFVSGYLVSKFDRFLEATLFPKTELDAGKWTGVGLFAAAVLSTALVVYSNRSYFRASVVSPDTPAAQNASPKARVTPP